MSAWPQEEDPFDRAIRVLDAARRARRRRLDELKEAATAEVEQLRRAGANGDERG